MLLENFMQPRFNNRVSQLGTIPASLLDCPAFIDHPKGTLDMLLHLNDTDGMVPLEKKKKDTDY